MKLLRFMAATVLLAATLRAQVDLVAVNVNIPFPTVQAVAGQTVTVNTFIIPLGAVPANFSYTYDLRFTIDFVVTASDPFVVSYTSTTFGNATHVVQIPLDIEPGPLWCIALDIHPSPGETNLSNNAVTGTQLVISPLYPGTQEDFELRTSIDGLPLTTGAVQTGSAGGTYTINVRSPNGAFSGHPFVLGAELWVPPTPPFAIAGYPYVWLDPLGSFIALNGFDPTSGVPPLSANGFSHTVPVPLGLGGVRVRLQAFTPSPSAANGILAATDAHDLILP